MSPFSRYVAIKFPSPRGHWYDFIDLYDGVDDTPIMLLFEGTEYIYLPDTEDYDNLIKGILKVAKLYEEYKTKNELVDFMTFF